MLELRKALDADLDKAITQARLEAYERDSELRHHQSGSLLEP